MWGVKGLTKLLDLNLEGEYKITDEGLKSLCNLEILDLNNNTNITVEGLKSLCKLDLKKNITFNPLCKLKVIILRYPWSD